MSLRIYFDHNMNRAIALALRARGIDVLLAAEDGTARLADEPLLARATELGRVLVTEDKDFLAITTRWLRAGRHFAGVVRAPKHLPIGRAIEELEVLAGVLGPAELLDRVEHLPLR